MSRTLPMVSSQCVSLSKATNQSELISNLSHMLCRHHNTKGYNNHTLEPLTNKFNTQVQSLQEQCPSHILLIGTSTDPCLRCQDGQECQRSSPQTHKPHPLSHALCKNNKMFLRCLTPSCDDLPSN